MLALLAENWNFKEIDAATRTIWMKALRKVPDLDIECGMERCLQELEYFPKIYEFMQRISRPDRHVREEETRLALPEPERHPVPMPKDLRAKLQSWTDSTRAPNP
jgi:hypothetical protein